MTPPPGRRRRSAVGALAVVGALAGATLALAPPDPAGGAGGRAPDGVEYAVLYQRAAAPRTARAALVTAGAELLSENPVVGLALVRSTAPDFLARAAAQPALAGAVRNRPIGRDPVGGTAPDALGGVRSAGAGFGPATAGANLDLADAPTAEPLARRQWDMAMIKAGEQGAFATQRGRASVLVGVVDTGIDASHPDIAPNFDAALSRNFTVDVPVIDGPCEVEADRSCQDPADVDENGHGTHVAGTVGAALNGLGIAGVAPGVRLVSLRAGQDSGYFFLKPTVDAITYAADHGVDVVNLSFFVDPWLFNCPDNPADSPAEQLEQRTIVAAVQAAVDHAWQRGATVVAALGNEHTDLSAPTFDATSPDFPPFAARRRPLTPGCVVVPAQLTHVIGVVAVGPSGKKADYSNWGAGQADLAAPGGFLGDHAGTPAAGQITSMVLSTWPEAVGRREGTIRPDGQPATPAVVEDCTGGPCAYWRYLEGTSMAAPHVAGAAALVVSQHGVDDPVQGGLTLDPALVERYLAESAADVPCDAACVGDERRNGIYGEGIVDVEAAVTASVGR